MILISKHTLIVTSVASMIKQFNMNNIKILIDLGCIVHVATNFKEPGNITIQESDHLIKELEIMGVKCHHLSFKRGFGTLRSNIQVIKELKLLREKYQYKMVHCQSPIGGMLSRIVFKKYNGTIIYTAHGFHFYRGGPIINWLTIYPVERLLSRYTDKILVINRSDYKEAKNLKAKEVILIPGVGIDYDNFMQRESDSEQMALKRQLKVDAPTKILLSIGELNKNKNHSLVIQSLKELESENIFYIIIGIGNQYNELNSIVKNLGLEEKVKFIGYTNNVRAYLSIADVFIFPSLREGLGLSALEAMAMGIPIIGSSIGGLSDILEDGKTGRIINNLNDATQLSNLIKCTLKYSEHELNKIAFNNQTIAKRYDINIVNQIMKNIYKESI